MSGRINKPIVIAIVWNTLGVHAACFYSFGNCNNNGISHEAYIGIGIGVVVFFVLLVLLSNYFRRRRAYRTNMAVVTNMRNQPGYNAGPYGPNHLQNTTNLPGYNPGPYSPNRPQSTTNQPGYDAGPYSPNRSQSIPNYPPPPPTPPPGHMTYYSPPPGPPPSQVNSKTTYDPVTAPQAPPPIYQV